jgi:hypothetical protein
MNAELIRDIEKSLEIQSKDLLQHNIAQGMMAAHLNKTVPCPECELDIYARTYEHIDTMLLFGDD